MAFYSDLFMSSVTELCVSMAILSMPVNAFYKM